MKKLMIGIIAMLFMALSASGAFAGKQGDMSKSKGTLSWLKPTLSVGYAYEASKPDFTFTTKGIDLGGGSKIDIQPPRLSGIYLAGELPFDVTSRLKLALQGTWTGSLTNKDMFEEDNDGQSYRSWDLVNHSDAVSASFLASYAFVKDRSFIKDIAAVAGVRWDYHTMRFDQPTDAFGVLTSPTDTLDISMHTLTPVFGFTGTFKGFKSGIFGGDIRLGLLGGPIVWGHLKYDETFTPINLFHSADDLHSGYLLNAFAEITVLSGKITSGMHGSLSLFGRYTRSSEKGTANITWTQYGTFVDSSPFDFDTASDVVAIGLKAAINF